MWEPLGPLPASVYWRRRWLALASVIALFAVLGWTVAAMLASPTQDPAGEPTTMAASRAALTETVTGSATPGPDLAGIGLPTTTGPADGAPPALLPTPGAPGITTGPGTQLPATVTGTVPGTDEQVRQDDTPRPSVDVPASVQVPATGPVPCTNAMLTVGAEIDRTDHKVGDKPVFRLVVTNVSDQPCVRDLDGSRQEIVVWSGDGVNRLWSSNDCVNPASADLRTLVPGQPLAFSVTWLGRTSAPGCAQARTPVPAGAYRVMTRVDDLVSAPTPFLLT